ncbi:MAG: hypothetical protein RJA36_1311 [Pseudomonadota bacterium]
MGQSSRAVVGPLEPSVGRPLDEATDDERDFDDGQDDAHCWECGELHDMCECRVGEECGRWRNGRLDKHCSKAGSEECDFECPYNR